MQPGIYELLATRQVINQFQYSSEGLPEFQQIPDGEDPAVLGRHLSSVIHSRLESLPSQERVAWANSVLRLVTPDSTDEIPEEDSRASQLLEVRSSTNPRTLQIVRPSTPLSDAALLTNARDEPGLGSELRLELASADSVDLLCAFVKWHGLRILEDELRAFHDRGGRLRVITTTYMGATERRALDRLVRDFGAEVRVNFETRSTRLHAKAWLFARNSGFDTAYVGSSNLSKSALVDGLEWNVRLSHVGTPALMRKFEATFESYWADESFKTYNPDADGELLDRELKRGNAYDNNSVIELSGLDVKPYPHQEEILAALESERIVHDRHQNLVVAATGTGKTVIAALDYRNLTAQNGGRRPRLLFVAHRKEILLQSLRTYREVLRDSSFGEVFVDGQRPSQWNFVFASIQSLNSYGMENIGAEHFEVVVVDEFHHAEAASYRRLLGHFEPNELLGLTATPERGDGENVRKFFGGRTAAELRIWDALEADLLVPFHYFGVSDGTNLVDIQWRRGSYDTSELERVYTGNDARARLVLQQLDDKVDVSRMRALGFCVSVAHANYMTRKFQEAGIHTAIVTGQTPPQDRFSAVQKLRDGSLNCIFTVDVFNEGVDIPEVDTVLMLRPTESSTIFLQQLGRGLRRSHGKSVLTVLDFIGAQNAEFRFDNRYRALTGVSRKQLKSDIETGFPYLPSGSQIVLDSVSQEIILENVGRQLGYNITKLASDFASHVQGHDLHEYSLAEFLEDSGREIVDIYKNNTWTKIRRRAFPELLIPRRPDHAEAMKEEEALLRRVRAFTHVNDPQRAEAYERLLGGTHRDFEEMNHAEQAYARMLFFLLWPNGGGFNNFDQGLVRIRQFTDVVKEIQQVIRISADASREVPAPLNGSLFSVPLFSHAKYRREEILAALGHATLKRTPSSHREGVAWIADLQTDAFLVNLHKSKQRFSPNTMYKDFALSRDLFHWESQSTTSEASPTGQRYINQRGNTEVLIFVREAPDDELGAAPFMLLGQSDYVSHSGSKPIAITWKLRRPMPPAMYIAASAVAR